MAVLVDEVSAPATMAEAIAILKRHPDAVPWAGGTLLMTGDDRQFSDKPISILDLGGIQELSTIHRSDRHIEFGALVALADVLALPPSLALEPLRQAIRLVGTATVRNLATIGGNVAARTMFMACFAALACMDAAVEVRDHQGARWTGIHSLIGADNRPGFPRSSILTRIRVSIDPWDWAVLKRLGGHAKGEPHPASFAASARVDKGTISELRLVAAGPLIARDRTLELSLVGRRLPLAPKDVEAASRDAGAKALETGFDEARAGLYGRYVGAFLSGMAEA